MKLSLISRQKLKALLLERIVKRVDGCWDYIGNHTNDGYSRIGFENHQYYVHRLMFLFSGNELKEGKELDHLCRYHGCVNPDDLEQVTHKVNLERGVCSNREKTQCVNGHEFTDDNIYWRKNGGRNCKQCILNRNAKAA